MKHFTILFLHAIFISFLKVPCFRTQAFFSTAILLLTSVWQHAVLCYYATEVALLLYLFQLVSIINTSIDLFCFIPADDPHQFGFLDVDSCSTLFWCRFVCCVTTENNCSCWRSRRHHQWTVNHEWCRDDSAINGNSMELIFMSGASRDKWDKCWVQWAAAVIKQMQQFKMYTK